MAKPQRIRSRTMILIYSNFDSLSLIMDHLKTTFRIRDENDWTFVMKTEHTVQDQKNIIVYIEFNFDVDVYYQKLDFKHENRIISPSVYCWSDKEFLLRYVLTFYGVLNLSTNILTNMDHSKIEETAIVLKTEDKAVVPQLERQPIHQSKVVKESDTTKPFMQEKQIEKFNEYFTNFTNTLSASSGDTNKLKELERSLRNMINYRSSYLLPNELQDCIKECQLKLKEFKRSL